MSRTTWWWLGAVVALVAVTFAVAGGRLLTGSDTAPSTGADPVSSPTAVTDASPTALTDASCSPAVEPPLQDGTHLLGDAEPPVPYSSTPATSGWHAAGDPRTGVIPADDPLTDPELVLTIEVGHVVVAYDPARVDETDVTRLADLADGEYRDRLTVTPYEGAQAPLSLVAWGVLQSCEELDRDVLDAFVAAHADPDAAAH